MNKWIAILLYIFSGFIAALSQYIMKKEAVKHKEETGIRRMLHVNVIFSYVLMFSTIFINMIAMRYIPYKYAPILTTFSYIFVLILGYYGLNERIGKKKALGAFFILLGVVIFNIN